MNLPAPVSTGLILSGEYTQDLEIGGRLRDAAESLQWALGDWVLAMQERHGDSVASLSADMSSVTGVAANSLRDYARTAKAIPVTDRLSDLSFGHHSSAASAENPVEVLTAARAEGLGVRDVRRLAKGLPAGGEEEAKAQSSIVAGNATLEEAALEALGLAATHVARAAETMSKAGFRLTLPVGQGLRQRLAAIADPFKIIEERVQDEVGHLL